MLTFLSVVNKNMQEKRQRRPHLCHEALGETVSSLTLASDVSCKEMRNMVAVSKTLPRQNNCARVDNIQGWHL